MAYGDTSAPEPFERRSALATMLIIARRGALEALRDRSTLLSGLIAALVFPAFLILSIIRSLAADPRATSALGVSMAILMTTVGLVNTSSAVGIASGVFAGEKEKGNLAPLLASPASNVAIFGGKILSAVFPALLFAASAEIAYLLELSALIGPDKLRYLPVPLASLSLLLVPMYALLSASIASIISSRVRTYTAAQTIGSFVLLPLWLGVLALTGAALRWGLGILALTALVLIAMTLLLIVLGAVTWRREEVLARQ